MANTKVYIEHGGAKQVVASGGEIEVQSGATLDVQSGATLNLHGSALSSTEFGYIDGVTAGTVAASKACVASANKDLGDFRNLDCVNLDAGASGAAGTLDVFPSTAAKGKLVISCDDQDGDTSVTLKPAAMGQATVVSIPDPGAATANVLLTDAANDGAVVSATAAEINTACDGASGGVRAGKHTVTAGEASAGTLDIVTGITTVVAHFVQVLDSGGNVATADADITESGGTLTIADGSTYATTESEVIHWIAIGS